MSSLIKYRYAYNQKGDIICIDDISDTTKEDVYRCISCGGLMIAKLGKKNKHHFAHKQATECNGETYLHKLAKTIIKQNFDSSNEFLVAIPQKCICEKSDICPLFEDTCCSVVSKLYDLKALGFTICETEKIIPGTNYVADVLLSRGNTWIDIEIKVTHKTEEKKIQEAGRIIEITITNENDVDVLKNYPLGSVTDNYQYYGFKDKAKETFPPKNINKPVQHFKLFKSGKCHLTAFEDYESCSSMFTPGLDYTVAEYCWSLDGPSSLYGSEGYQVGTYLCIKRGLRIGKCGMCYFFDKDYVPQLCRKHKTSGTPRYPIEAGIVDCPFFQIDSRMEILVKNLISTNKIFKKK